MAEIKWIKLSVNMFDDEKVKLIRTLPEGESIILIWIQLLCLAGKINDGGLVYMGQNLAYSDEMLATILDHPLNNMRSALKTLEQFEMIQVNNNGFIDIVNWEKHQNIEGMERIREQNRLRKQKQRNKERQKELAESVTSRDSHATDKNKTRLDKIRLDKDIDYCNSSNPSQNDISEVFNFYQNNFGVLSPFIHEDIMDWCQTLSPELTMKAMQKAIESNKPYSYAKGILKNWLNNNIKTLEDAEAEEVQYQQRKSQNKTNRFYKKEEVKPGWMNEDRSNQPLQNSQELDHEDPSNEEIRAKLAKVMGGNK